MNTTRGCHFTLGKWLILCINSFVLTNHIHNGHVLWVNAEGGEQYNLKGCTTILQPGSVSIIEPGIGHSNRPGNPYKRHFRSIIFEL